MSVLLHPDDWLTAQLARPSYRLDVDAAARDGAEPVFAPPEPNAFAWTRVAVDDVETVGTLGRAGYGVVDCGLTFEAEASKLTIASNTAVRAATADDRDAMIALAGTAFHVSRFHLDPCVDDAVADALKAAWVASAFDGTRGDGIVVAPGVGFLIWLLATDGAAVIDLVAVDSAARGRGVVGALTRAAWQAAGAPERLRVGTQAANAAASRAYVRLGFTPVAARYVLHYHGAGDDVRT